MSASAVAAAAAAAPKNATFFCHGDGMIMYMDGFRMSLRADEDAPCLNLLIPAVTLNTRAKFGAAVVAVFAFAVAVEGLAKLRHATVAAVQQSGRRRRQPQRAGASRTAPSWPSRCLLRYGIPVLHGLQALTGYALMLVTMTFSVELLTAVVLGLTCGYALFFGTTASDVQHVTTNPCCEYMQEESKESMTTAMMIEPMLPSPAAESNRAGGARDDEDSAWAI